MYASARYLSIDIDHPDTFNLLGVPLKKTAEATKSFAPNHGSAFIISKEKV